MKSLRGFISGRAAGSDGDRVRSGMESDSELFQCQFFVCVVVGSRKRHRLKLNIIVDQEGHATSSVAGSVLSDDREARGVEFGIVVKFCFLSYRPHDVLLFQKVQQVIKLVSQAVPIEMIVSVVKAWVVW